MNREERRELRRQMRRQRRHRRWVATLFLAASAAWFLVLIIRQHPGGF